MSDRRQGLRVALLGGVPAVLGGGGLELQVDRTAQALNCRGHDARLVAAAPADWEFDVLHVFGPAADVGHVLGHWRRHPARLVISPVVVVPVARERRLLLATRLPIPAFEPRVLAAMVRRADQLVALTAWEATFLRRVGRGGCAPISVVGNGVDLPDGVGPQSTFDGEPLPERYVVTVGAVSERKRQLAIARALRGVAPYVVVGGWDGPADQRQSFEGTVRATGGRWIGEVTDQAALLSLVAGADALIHLSEAEGMSLAVLEALAVGTPCVLSDLPQQRELQRRWPTHVQVVARDEQLPEALARARASGAEPSAPEVPTWDEVASDLEAVYVAAMGEPARLWNARG